MVSKPEDLVQTIAGEGVLDPRLLEAVRTVPRAGFVPDGPVVGYEVGGLTLPEVRYRYDG